MRSENGERLLYAVSARREMTWAAFRNASDALLRLQPDITPDMRRARSLAASLGDALGHWDVINTEDMASRICVAPPCLVRLPWPGLPRAVLCGSRSSDTLDAVAAAAARVRATVNWRTVHPYGPLRIEVRGHADADLADLADGLAISYDPNPPAWQIANMSCSLEEYLSTLEWMPEIELNWPRQEFDPQLQAFRPTNESVSERQPEEELRLVSYDHPGGWTRRDRLILRGRTAAVDRSWARYAVLAARGQRVMYADPRAGTMTVPRQLPLPKLLSRALTLCSGAPAQVLPGPGLGLHLYSDVPVTIMNLITAKLGQNLPGAHRVVAGSVS